MENARPQQVETSASDKRHFSGNLPARINTATASFLATLIEGRELTGLEAVFSQSTTRAAAWVFYLESKYGWNIQRRDVACGTNDGRISWATCYWLSAQDRELAFAAGARAWVDAVNAATEKRRANAEAVKAEAARLNVKRGAA